MLGRYRASHPWMGARTQEVPTRRDPMRASSIGVMGRLQRKMPALSRRQTLAAETALKRSKASAITAGEARAATDV
ncbi:MAG: hypothetical protein JWN04_3527 [Myxococcaceae bacterium]|nr:hypothetical protein [Myxococcaceae bacterium]